MDKSYETFLIALQKKAFCLKKNQNVCKGQSQIDSQYVINPWLCSGEKTAIIHFSVVG